MTTSPNGKTAQRKKLRIAVVQPHLAVGAVEMNLRLCASLVREASVMHSPDVILLPEAMTSPNMFHRSLRRVPQPVDGAPYQLIVRLAKELHCTVGGGFLSVRGQHARHTYVLAEPDGTTHLHDKDEPSMWETNFYTAGKDQGLASTSFGNVGLAMGFEWGRSRTARRLRNKVDVVLGGSCWWGGPTWPVMRDGWRATISTTPWRAVKRRPGWPEWSALPVAVAQHVGPSIRIHRCCPVSGGRPCSAANRRS